LATATEPLACACRTDQVADEREHKGLETLMIAKACSASPTA